MGFNQEEIKLGLPKAEIAIIDNGYKQLEEAEKSKKISLFKKIFKKNK